MIDRRHDDRASSSQTQSHGLIVGGCMPCLPLAMGWASFYALAYRGAQWAVQRERELWLAQYVPGAN